MKLATIQSAGRTLVGVYDADGVVHDTGYTDMRELIADSDRGLDSARAAIERGAVVDVQRVLAPLRPGKIFGTGINYRTHVDENPAFVASPTPVVNFIKPATAIIADGDTIELPPLGGIVSRPDGWDVSYEVELGVVIGAPAKRVRLEDAPAHIFGYTIVNDLTSAAMIEPNSQLTLAKAFDTFAPLGPCIVTADEFDDLGAVRLQCWVNGEQLQDAVVADQIYTPAALVSWLSAISTLESGDVISSGTPNGTPWWTDQPRWLRDGDVVVCEISGVGRLTNPVVQTSSTHVGDVPCQGHS